jgi:anti-sigma regulatory factor (Ser/Thr protein kinase)
LRLEIERDARGENLQAFREFIEDACRRAGVEPSAAFDLKLAVDEACSNIIEHGYSGSEPGPIGVSFDAGGGQVVVEIADWGRPFDPKSVRAPDLDSRWQDRRVGGLGWYLISRSVDTIGYDSDPQRGNRLTLIKKVTLGESARTRSD